MLWQFRLRENNTFFTVFRTCYFFFCFGQMYFWFALVTHQDQGWCEKIKKHFIHCPWFGQTPEKLQCRSDTKPESIKFLKSLYFFFIHGYNTLVRFWWPIFSIIYKYTHFFILLLQWLRSTTIYLNIHFNWFRWIR